MAAPQKSPYWDLARRLLDHFSVCRPLMTDEQLQQILKHDEEINARFDALPEDHEMDEYHAIMDDQLKSPFLDEQQDSYEAYLTSVIKNFPELEGISREYLSDALDFYFEYYFGDGGPSSQETVGVVYKLEAVLPNNQAFSFISK